MTSGITLHSGLEAFFTTICLTDIFLLRYNCVYRTLAHQQSVLFCSLAVLDPKVGHTMDVLSPFIPVLCHSD